MDRNYLRSVFCHAALDVALRKESVDRNRDGEKQNPYRSGVALRKESVDRNRSNVGLRATTSVALRKESVDRNADNNV